MDRAVTIELAGVVEPLRWILAEEVPLFHTAFLAGDGTAGEAIDDARETIVRRFLRTRALIGLSELTARYPISSAEATELLDRWAEEGKVVRMVESGSNREMRWSERENLNEIRRMTVAVRRRESLAVTPEVFADFLLRWQHVHPSTRGDGPSFVEVVLDQLQGSPLRPRTGKARSCQAGSRTTVPVGSTMFSDERAGSGEPRRGRGTSRKSRFSVVIFSASSAATANRHRSRLRKRR